MWIATVDFAKAFDTIKHKALWTALTHFGIESHYMCLLKRFFADQKATVSTDTESDIFEIKRGTKQADPLSSLLFNIVLQAALEYDLARWREKGMGISLGVLQSDCLSNLRFTDDVLLFSASLDPAQKYEVRLQEKYRKRGTENPPGKRRKFSATKDRTEEKR